MAVQYVLQHDHMPVTYNGESKESATVHLLRFDDYLNENKITEQKKAVEHFRLPLGATPRAWYEANKAEFGEDLEKLKTMFKARFGKNIPHTDRIRAFRSETYKSGEYVTDYKNRLTMAGNKSRC